MNRFFATLGVLAALVSSESVWANGRFPSAGHVEVDPNNPEHIVLRATYGLLVTHDGGKHWNWVCEKALTYSGVWDPPIGIMNGGAMLVGLPDGLSISTADACLFTRAPALEGQLVADVAVDKKNGARAVALTSLPLGTSFDTRLYLTENNASTFEQLGEVFPANFHGLTVDSSASDSSIIYVSGVLEGPMPQGVVLRSENGGSSYETYVVPNSDALHAPFLGAVDPENANRVYVRLDGTPGRLFVSEDGGKTWKELYWGQGALLGFSLAPDGKTLIVGGDQEGVWRSPVPNWAFEKTSALHARCLRWANEGIYACAEPVLDGFSVGLSVTQGSTFKPLAKLSDLCGPVSCPTPICTSDWPMVRDTLGATSCVEGSSSSSSGAGGTGGAEGNPGQTPRTPEGCACRVERGSERDQTWLVLLLSGLLRRNSGGRRRAYLARRSAIS